MPQNPTLQPYATGDELVADLQRQCGIVEAALVAAEARNEHPPLSGMPGCDRFHDLALAAAGETYRIVAGVKVPLTEPAAGKSDFEAYQARVLADVGPKKFNEFPA